MGRRGSTPEHDAVEAAVDAAFAATPRADFLPVEQRRYADLDRALPIGHGQTNSQPTTVRAMLRSLRVGEGMRVLDVGSGSGWTTVLLARLVGATGEVVGVERVPELTQAGAIAVAAAALPWARVEQAGAQLGRPHQAPWDRILVSAQGAEVPGDLVAQLGADGLMVVPVGGRLLRVDAHGRLEDLGGYVFVPLVREEVAAPGRPGAVSG